MKTVLDVLKHVHKMPEQIWNGSVNGPLSYDDPFEIYFWYQETAGGPVIRGTIQLEPKSITVGELK